MSSSFNHAQQSSDARRSEDLPSPSSSHTFASYGDNSEVLAPSYERPPSRTKLFLQSSLGVFRSKNAFQPPKSPKPSGPAPVPPPKPLQLQTSKKAPTSPSESSGIVEQSNSPIISSPSISAAIHFINNQDDGRLDKLDVPLARTETRPSAETKQDWRKSDSTMISYATIRPGALAGNRSPRPVSLAESSHSGHTIVPVNKRLSALIADPEFAMAEESDGEKEDENPQVPLSRHPSPPSSIKTRNRRSASLNHGATFGMWAKPASSEPFKPSVSESSIPLPRLSADYVRISPTSTRDAPTLTRAAASGIIAPTTAPDAPHSTSSNIRGRLAAWTAATSSSDRPLPPPQHPRKPNPSNNPTFRQTAVSMTGGLAPVALGLGKRAAEKVHRVWGGLSSSASSHSNYSSSSSLSGATYGTTPSSYAGGKFPDPIGRSASGQSISTQPSPGGWMRRTPNAPSGSWSVNSSQTSSSTSDSDAFMSSGPTLGTRLRGARRNSQGASVIGGVVFGLAVSGSAADPAMETSGVKPLEERMLPALVVRCAQHITRWGLQEEGLFRVSGRPSHVAKLRSEFDTGADFALVECDPGDLDPHAVASIFKAYLRELPESLLTTDLIPHFEAALATQRDASDTELQLHNLTNPSISSQSGGLPLLRKPPSLSTLAMPSFAGVRAISAETVRALAILVARLPRENRDLLYTVVELIQATAANSKETKMPLGNLLLVFCPSLNMSPPLLRVLCETKGIWEAPGGTYNSPVIPNAQSIPSTPAIPTSSSLIDLSVPSAEPGVILLDDTDYDSDLSDMPPAHLRNGRRRGPIAPLLQVPEFGGISPYRSSGGSSGQDDTASYVSALDRPFSRTSSPADSSHHLPALSNSTDSLATPSTMSEVSSLQSPANLFAPEPHREKSEPVVTTMPAIASQTDLPLPVSARRPLISAPIPFPSPPGGAPQTPVSPRKSLALLSFPGAGKSEPSSPQGPSKTWTHRNKRPSLTLLFSKRSASPLVPPQASSAKAGPGSSASPEVPRMPMYASASMSQHNLHSPAFLDTPISSSPLFEKNANRTSDPNSAMLSTSASSSEAVEDVRERKDSMASSLFSTPQQTPIADYFRNRSNTSLLSVTKDAECHMSPSSPKIALRSSPSKSSLTPSIDIGIEDSVGENWAQSVLLEAQAKSGGKSRWSVREAIKKFEGLT
ncbi:hypothetical protein NM688_g6778 [Phlebia brevispora]|uniref:Uncharacterized protein n=1 Tax=Phlebia brevispora TaxID=194682 RepID=A0ACC1SCX7_9APHY|nr:hypothetical protein NM688_g6778 [Phlebia brevispora]